MVKVMYEIGGACKTQVVH